MSTVDEQRLFLIRAFLDERPTFADHQIPNDKEEQRLLLRALFNTRPAGLPSQEILEVQDAYLQSRAKEKGVVSMDEIDHIAPHIRLWKGDITRLKCDAIVNAANSALTGCWAANHMCIDNAIHTFAGVQLRYKCDQIIKMQGHPEPTGCAKITPGYNLPAAHVIHTVGPIANGSPSAKHNEQLASSYRSCYELAASSGLKSIAYCCISTGVFGFPSKDAAKIAIKTVRELQAHHEQSNKLEVIFNVFSDRDYELYSELLAD